MAMIFASLFQGRKSSKSLNLVSGRFAQVVSLSSDVLSHVRKFRQVSLDMHEAGGQLFGTVSSDKITVISATGPYKGDDRGRYHYRSDSKAAQKAIDKFDKKGLLYLGEWHTHAESKPTPSGSDKDAIERIRKNSKLKVSQLFLLIVGQHPSSCGIYLCSVDGAGTEHWKNEKV